jgi:hypothetical protein
MSSAPSRVSHVTTRRVTLLLAAVDGPHSSKPEALMSARNGDRARFHKNRKRKLRHRQRIQELVSARRAAAPPRTNEQRTA